MHLHACIYTHKNFYTLVYKGGSLVHAQKHKGGKV